MPRLQHKVRVDLENSVVVQPDSCKTPLMRQVELRIGKPLEVYFIQRLKKQDTLQVMEADLRVDASTLCRWMRRLKVVSPCGVN